jgi:hypothetical protein
MLLQKGQIHIIITPEGTNENRNSVKPISAEFDVSDKSIIAQSGTKRKRKEHKGGIKCNPNITPART